LLRRFQRFDDLDDLNSAVRAAIKVMILTPNDHPNMNFRLYNLGDSLSFRFQVQRVGDVADIDQAISIFGEAADLSFDTHPDKGSHLNHTGKFFFCPLRMVWWSW
jgi:hypothetical protein